MSEAATPAERAPGAPTPPAYLPSIAVAMLAAVAWTASWEPPDLEGLGPVAVAAPVGAALGALWAGLCRTRRFGRSRLATPVFWMLALLASVLSLPTVRGVSPAHPDLFDLLQVAALRGVPRVLAHFPIAYALFPVATVGTIAVALVVEIVATLRAWGAPGAWRRRVSIFVVLAATGVTTMYAFKLGPGTAACERLVSEAAPLARLVAGNEFLSRHTDVTRPRAYDVQLVGPYLAVSLKVPPAQLGAIALLDPVSGALLDVRHVAELFERPPSVPLFPERMSARGGELYALLLGSRAAVAHLELDAAARVLVPRTVVELPGEANAVIAEPRSRRVWVLLAGATAMGIVEIDGDPPRVVRHLDDPGVAWAYQHAVLSEDGHTLLATAIGNDALIRFWLDPLIVERTVGFAPLIGVAAPGLGGDVYAADPLHRSVAAFSADDLRPQRSVPIEGSGLADLDVDPQLGVLAVGSYTGELAVLALPSLERRAEVRLGHMLRNITVDRERHVVYAAAGCGVFALDLEAALARAGR